MKNIAHEMNETLKDTGKRFKHFFTIRTIWVTLLTAVIVAAVVVVHVLGWAAKIAEASKYLVCLLDSVAWIAGGVLISKLVDLVMALTLRGSQRAQTIEKLVHSGVKYIAAIVVVIGLLVVWLGEEYVAGVVGGVGVLALIVGLGAQKLIGDIIAGVFMVFEGRLEVGDWVTIGDWRGQVEEIGIRTTIVVDDCGNEKVMTNSSINEFVNLSRNDSIAVCTFYVPYDVDVNKLEQVVLAALPALQEQIATMTQPAAYKGIEAIDGKGYLVKVIGFSKEEDRFQTQRDLYRAMLLALQNNGISVAPDAIKVNN